MMPILDRRLIHYTAKDFGYASSSDAQAAARKRAQQIAAQATAYNQQATAQQQEVSKLNTSVANTTDENGKPITGTNYTYTRTYDPTSNSTVITKLDNSQYDMQARTWGADPVTGERVGTSSVTAPQTSGANMKENATLLSTGQITQDEYNRRLEAERQQNGYYTASQPLDTVAQRREDRLAARLEAIDKRNAINATTGTALSPERLAQEKAAAAQQVTEEMKQEQIQQQNAANQANANAAASAATVSAQRKPMTQGSESSQVVPQSNPAIDALISQLPPEYQALGAALKASIPNTAVQTASAQGNLTDEVSQADATKAAYDKVLSQMSSDSKAIYDKMDSFIAETQQMREETAARQKESTLEQLRFEENRATREARKNLDKKLNSLVAAQAIGGGFGSSNWNADVADAEWEGEQAIVDLQKEFGFKRADVDIAFTEQMNGIYESYGQKKLDAMKEHKSEIQQINQMRFSATEKTEERKAQARETYRNTLASIAKEQATAMRDVTANVMGYITQSRDEKMAQEQLGWQRLQWVAETYGSNAPQSILASIAKQLPGVDISGVLANPTLAQSREARLGGGGGSGIGSYDFSAPEVAAFADISVNELREAVDRVTLNFGGTGAERNRKREEYLSRINSGEPVSSIMASMQNDYWASQKGAPRTAHDGRLEAQGSAEALQSFVDFYSIGEERDGPLGFIDSKVQAIGSMFGLSSEEYNNLAVNVGNIRARIIKENYGAAVTPQELKLAQSYIPSMSDKGAQFLTKLQNLKAYNGYLDAKVFASAVGLPTPTPPKPVTISGSSTSGPGKYTEDDILSTIK